MKPILFLVFKIQRSLDTRKAMLFIVLFCSLLVPVSAIQINEIMYNPDQCIYDNDCEWIEIYNDENITINLTGWTIDESAFGNINILAYEYIIIAKELIDGSDADIESFEFYWGNNDGIWNLSDGNYTAVDGSFSLTNTEDTIKLANASNHTIYNITYYNSWGANGDNNSLQLVNGTWFAAIPTPGAVNNISISEKPEENTTNETDIVDEDWCDLSVSINSTEIIIDGEIKYKIRVQDLHCQNIAHEYSIKYWITDLFGSYLKKPYTSDYAIICSDTSYHQKKTKDECGLNVYYIEAEITKHGCNDSNSLNDFAKQLAIVKGKSLNNTACNETIEIAQVSEAITTAENISGNKTPPITGAVVWFDEKSNNFTTLVLLYCFVLLIFVIALVKRN